MPGFKIHLAIAKRYIEKHDIKEIDEFIKGSIAPDFEFPKEISHYSTPCSSNSLIEKLESKVDIKKFVDENEIKTDYDKGVFIHLLTDKLFFTDFLDKDYLNSVSYNEFCNDLYFSYDKTNDYIKEKYSCPLSKEQQEKIEQNIKQNKKIKKVENNCGKEIFSIEQIENFIERVSDIDIKEYIKQIKSTK